MPRQVAATLLLIFLAVIGVNWPELPYNARIADVIFIPLAIVILTRPGAKWTWRSADLAVAAYLLGALPSIFVSSDSRQSVIEFSREVYLGAIYVIVAIAVQQGFARTIAIGLAFGAAMLSVLGLAVLTLQRITGAEWTMIGEVMQLPYIGGTLRLRALTATPAMLACVLTAAAPFAIALCRERARHWCAASIAMMIAAFFTFSHVIAGLAVAVLITAWPALEAWTRLRRLAIAGVAAIIIAFNVAATISITSFRYGDVDYADATRYQYAVGQGEAQLGGAAITYNVMSYARIKQVAWRTFVEHPIAGIGLDQFHSATRRAAETGALTFNYREIDPHSTLIGRFAESGIIGGLTLVLLWIAWAMMARDVVRGGVEPAIGYAAMAALAGLFIAGINADIMNFRFLWVAAGLLRGAIQTHPRP